MRFPALIVLAFGIAAPSVATQEASLHARLEKMFERPERTPISAEQKSALADFVKETEGQDLGDYGYVRAIHHYLSRDYVGAAKALDGFLSGHDAVPIEEHSMMCGRIYVNAVMRAAGDESADQLASRSEWMVRLYSDRNFVSRFVPSVVSRYEGQKQAAVRVGIVRGMVKAGYDIAASEKLLGTLYGDTAASPRAAAGAAPMRRAIPATPMRRIAAPPGARAAALAADKVRAELPGQAAPALAVETIAQGPAGLSLEAMKGKVVVLDFTATWCGPCRKIIPEMRALQAEHASDLQVVAVTRYYGYGADYRDGGTGKSARDLSREDELVVNQAFAKQFEIEYPVVLVPQATFKSYGVRGIPTVAVIGRDGKVVGMAVGANSHDAVAGFVKQALDGS